MDNRRSSAQSTGGGNGSIEVQVDNGESSGSSSRGTVSQRPEKKLVQFAMVLVFLKRTSTAIGALGFFWAATVILGNLASISYKTDFYFITIILITEWARNFSLGRDLEWLESPWTISDALKGLANKVISVCNGRNLEAGTTGGDTQQLMATSTSSTQGNPLLSSTQGNPLLLRPDADDLLVLSSNSRKVLYCLQVLSALSCITLSVVRLVQLSLGAPIDPTSSGDHTNLRAMVYVFYVMAIAQASLSLAEKAYWEWTITYRRLLEEVNEVCELGMIPITSFFYHAYSERVDGKIFDGLSQQLDLFSFASNFLNTRSRHQQLIGIRILLKFSTDDRYSSDTLRNIGTSMPVMEKLLYMLSWKGPKETEIREKAAKIVVKLAGKRWNSFRLSGFPGALENIFSLIDGANPKELMSLGITIFKKLSHDCTNCVDIADSRSVMMVMISAFDDPAYHDHSAKILNNCCKYAGCNCLNKAFGEQSSGVTTVALLTLKMLMTSKVKEKPPQILVELARLLVTYMNDREANVVIMKAGMEVLEVESLRDNQNGVGILTIKLQEILQEYHRAILEQPTSLTRKQWEKVHETTVNTVGLAIETMENVEHAVTTMRSLGMKNQLRQILEAMTRSTMVEELRQILEAARLDMGSEDIDELIESALQLLGEEE